MLKPLADHSEMWGTVLYVIGPKRGPVKIGISGSALTRLRELQIGHPFELTILAEVAVPRNGQEIEERIHSFFLRHRTRNGGEWFHRSHEIQKFVDMVACRLSPEVAMQKLEADRQAYWAAAKEAELSKAPSA